MVIGMQQLKYKERLRRLGLTTLDVSVETSSKPSDFSRILRMLTIGNSSSCSKIPTAQEDTA